MGVPNRIGAAVALAALALAGSARPASLTATPANFEAILGAAGAGDVLTLAPGDYGAVAIRSLTWSSPVTIDARAATFQGISLTDVDGLAFSGGAINGVGSYGVHIVTSRHVSVTGMQITGIRSGVVIDRSDDIAATHLLIFGSTSDGIDIAMAHRILIDHDTCKDFHPRPATYDAAGKLLVDGDHPDCVQAWSRSTAPPTSDLTITNNTADGNMQGFSLFNHVRAGVDDGGFDRVIITGNVATISYPDGVSLYSARNSVVRDNDVRSIPGSMMPKRADRADSIVKTKISVIGGAGNIVCGNRSPDAPNTPATIPCH